jgi:hypothetical protein
MIAPGLLVKVQVPVAGKLFNTTLPVATAQVGWVIGPIAGAGAKSGAALIIMSDDEDEVQPAALVTE